MTTREKQILLLMFQGKTTEGTAEEFGRSPATISRRRASAPS